jgi:hypothetical protein
MIAEKAERQEGWKEPYGSVCHAMKSIRVALVALAICAWSQSARADVTVFLGSGTSPSNRQTRGFAVGAGLLIVGFEFEYGNTREDAENSAPSLKTGMGNVLLQTPVAIAHIQPYFTTGGGYYQEALGGHEDSGFGANTGGGAKITLAGPLRLRVDYRLFKLGSGALSSPAHRFYMGINLKF